METDPLLTAIAPLRCVAITQQFNRLSTDTTQPNGNPATGQSLMFVGGFGGVVKGTATDAANEKKGLLDVSEITWSNSNLTDIKDP
ncbi:MAG: hypothetical protein IPP67_03680 [Rhodospirillaceae bacterium]|nr:hypothetical protein [Rhodospirillaceae bacterium]